MFLLHWGDPSVQAICSPQPFLSSSSSQEASQFALSSRKQSWQNWCQTWLGCWASFAVACGREGGNMSMTQWWWGECGEERWHRDMCRQLAGGGRLPPRTSTGWLISLTGRAWHAILQKRNVHDSGVVIHLCCVLRRRIYCQTLECGGFQEDLSLVALVCTSLWPEWGTCHILIQR